MNAANTTLYNLIANLVGNPATKGGSGLASSWAWHGYDGQGNSISQTHIICHDAGEKALGGATATVNAQLGAVNTSAADSVISRQLIPIGNAARALLSTWNQTVGNPPGFDNNPGNAPTVAQFDAAITAVGG